MRALIVGGGTGGHVIPAIAIARELKAAYNAEILFVGTPRGVEGRMVPAAGFDLRMVQVGALKNVSAITRLKTAFALPTAILAASKIISEFNPTIVVGVGGYASGPGMIAAILRGVPTLAFEPNLVPGFANRKVARFVKGAAVQFAATAKYFHNAQVTGVPIRKEFAAIRGLPQEQVLLVTGGSQGAHAINQAICDALPKLKQSLPHLRIIHQTGQKDEQPTRNAYAQVQCVGEVSAFIENMADAFSQASVVVCRSGASTVAEVVAAGRVAVFIPFPHAADDHQKHNAQALVDAGAALMIEQKDLTPDRLHAALVELLRDRVRLETMSAAARRMAHADAAAEIGKLAYSIERKN